ncbi:MAG: 3-isopropylmalate dehydratase small subunit [Chloroflexi bacterium]|nr:3-isopropylmalate dehydratase small subunit [Chloroflexota bacterium]
MRKYETVRSKALPLNRADVDTDQIIPAKYLKRIERSGFGQFLFDDWRKDSEFILNEGVFQGSRILLAGENFGCGSSREHAPWALEDYGFRALIAPSFADIFRNNCAKIGLLTITLAPEDVQFLMARAEELPEAETIVDLESQTVATADGSFVRSFEIDPAVKRNLIEGLDAIGLTLEHEDEIAAFEADRPDRYPSTASAEPPA